MQYNWVIGAVLLIAALPGSLNAALSQSAVKAYVCDFTTGQTTSWNTNWASPESEAFASQTVFVFKEKSRAQMIGHSGAADVLVVSGDLSFHFLERTDTGNFTLTTVFADVERPGFFPAVHSRHMNIFGQPRISQLRGSCTARH
jgi:hypothetical protein